LYSSVWAWLAGGWMFLKYFDATAEITAQLNANYGHICTCLVDLNGLKSAFGTTTASNYAFSSCSEHA